MGVNRCLVSIAMPMINHLLLVVVGNQVFTGRVADVEDDGHSDVLDFS